MGVRFGSEAYAMEELVAELSSAILGAELGLPVDHVDHHASYLASWLKVLKTDSRAILTVAAKAEEAGAPVVEVLVRRSRRCCDDELCVPRLDPEREGRAAIFREGAEPAREGP